MTAGRFYKFARLAYARGSWHSWPHRPSVPKGYSGVSCALTLKDARDVKNPIAKARGLQATSPGFPARGRRPLPLAP